VDSLEWTEQRYREPAWFHEVEICLASHRRSIVSRVYVIYTPRVFSKLNAKTSASHSWPRRHTERSAASRQLLLDARASGRSPNNAISGLFWIQNSPCKKKERRKNRIDLVGFQWHRPCSARNTVGLLLLLIPLSHPPHLPEFRFYFRSSSFSPADCFPLSVSIFSYFFSLLRSTRSLRRLKTVLFIYFFLPPFASNKLDISRYVEVHETLNSVTLVYVIPLELLLLAKR